MSLVDFYDPVDNPDILEENTETSAMWSSRADSGQKLRVGQGNCKELRRVDTDEVAVAVSYQNKKTFDPALRVDVVRSREFSRLILFLRPWKQRLCKVEQTHTVLPYSIEEKGKSIFLEACVDLDAWSGVH